MRILAIETTCDETGASVMEDGRIISNVVFSQVSLHKKYHGVVPELASRAHMEKISSVVKTALEEAGIMKKGVLRKKINLVAFARGPGLPGALLVGRMAAQTVSEMTGAGIMGVNHLEGHFLSPLIKEGRVSGRMEFPVIGLIVSGGHTELWLSRKPGDYSLLGKTRDDAAGEAFDKVAKLLGLPYPGGPRIEKEALKASRDLGFPKPFAHGGYEFSFSGIKTAVAYYLRDNFRFDGKKYEVPPEAVANICFSFQKSVVDVLVAKAVDALKREKARSISAGGGVTANSFFRKELEKAAAAAGAGVYFCEKKYSADNAAMLAALAWIKVKSGAPAGGIKTEPRLSVGGRR